MKLQLPKIGQTWIMSNFIDKICYHSTDCFLLENQNNRISQFMHKDFVFSNFIYNKWRKCK